MKSAKKKLTDANIDSIMSSAKTFSKASRREECADDEDPEDERANLESGSSGDESDESSDGSDGMIID
jgi:hypothetical protein